MDFNKMLDAARQNRDVEIVNQAQKTASLQREDEEGKRKVSQEFNDLAGFLSSRLGSKLDLVAVRENGKLGSVYVIDTIDDDCTGAPEGYRLSFGIVNGNVIANYRVGLFSRRRNGWYNDRFDMQFKDKAELAQILIYRVVEPLERFRAERGY